MSFLNLNLKSEYRSLREDVIKNFYNPALNEAVLYKRAVGFFSSSALIAISEGICGLIKNGGEIKIIASPKLSTEDLDAINAGFKRREEIIKNALIRELQTPQNIFEENRLNLLSNLIAVGKLDFKIAFLEENNSVGMFHEKLGLIYDAEGNKIAFSGSMNESANAFFNNYESIDIFTSWTHDAGRVENKISAFDALWNNSERGIKVLKFPEVGEEILRKYKFNDKIDTTLDDKDFKKISVTVEKNFVADNFVEKIFPVIPKNILLRDYQISAVENFAKKNYRGIFDMATGTGKTITALAAVEKLFADKKNLAVLIVCPYQHLVEQWSEEIILFGIKPIICYSASKQKNWRERLKTSVKTFNSGAKNFFCMLSTNATFSTKFVQDEVKKLSGNVLLVVDEAHNFGAKNLSKTLLENFKYRLALSATIDRHGDEEGTQKLYNYFGEKCIEYSLSDAIKNNMLTPYKYFPVVVSLNEVEREEYLNLTAKIRKGIIYEKNGKIKFTESAKMLLIKRARLVSGAEEKISALREAIQDFKNDNQILVYCGATTLRDVDYHEGEPIEEEIRQIDAVVKMLGLELNMRVSKFTSQENSAERELLKKNFEEGNHLQALVAIRCLDEGVNIPSIRTAFILASSTNPKEYIQRRGRVLRKFPGKNYATIFDFITLPIPLEEVENFDSEVVDGLKSLAKRELSRLKTFAADAENPFESDELAFEIQNIYQIEEQEEEENYV